MEMYSQILSQEADMAKVPEYIKILPMGYVSSEKGDFWVDEESFRMMKEYMNHRKIDIVVDYEHQTLKNIQAPASGWIKEIVLKNNGIYAKVEWTAKARNYLRNREYRYISPVVLVRKEDNKVLQLHSVALTNTPAINGMKPIVNSLKIPFVAKTEPESVWGNVCRMLNICDADYRKFGDADGER